METEINAYDLVHMWKKLKKSLCDLFLLLHPAPGAQPEEEEESVPGTYWAPDGTQPKQN